MMESKLAQNCARHNIASGFVHSRGRNWEKSFLPTARNNNLPLPLARAKVDRSQSVFYFIPQENILTVKQARLISRADYTTTNIIPRYMLHIEYTDIL